MEQLVGEVAVGQTSSSSVNSKAKTEECHPGGSHGLAQLAPRSDLEAEVLMKKESLL